MDIFTRERQQAFSLWLRTGRLPLFKAADGRELKFNPWHDWVTGRFTFVGAGRYTGGWMSGGFHGGGGGSAGGGGATGRWEPTTKHPARPAPRAVVARPSRHAGPPKPAVMVAIAAPRASRPVQMARSLASPIRKIDQGESPAAAAHPKVDAPQVLRVVRNGYEYQIDGGRRTVRVSGMLRMSERPQRSRSSQARAGGADRRRSDDGGHYIAARFDGPADAFNHFTQDANFNRGGYKALENECASAIKSRQRVSAVIKPSYNGSSIRPVNIEVVYRINNREDEIIFPNERQEKTRGK